ncbi:MAG: NAD+ synthase [Candidatus Bathyarchaeota archaeon]|nr:NAD+ synthase [Candidatus Bathyarchaeota archaeon]MDH5494369.1 NAD+ synthase [Candidatus Bathyarchaeota archaeon]
MKLTNKLLQIDPAATQQKITRFIKDYVSKAKAKGIVLGISGGVDSATTAALATTAIGANKVLGLYMPEKETYNKTDRKHVKLLAKKFKFQLKTINLTQTLNTIYKTIPDYDPKDKLSRGNLKARTRMLIWYYYANHQRLLVAGSSDKSETMIGYYTKWGDAAADITPIMDLYKTQVRQLAPHLGIPPAIIKKPPTPALWPNQTAEEEIGLKYETLDLILYGIEHFMPTQTIAKQLHLLTKTIATVKKRWLQTEHKRQMPLTTKLEYRTINADFRLTRTTEAI